MPEFYSISIFRREEYAKAKVPVSAVVRGVPATIRHIIIFALFTVIATLVLAVSPLASMSMTLVLVAVSVIWLHVVFKGLKAEETSIWAKKEFRFALIFLVVFCVIISINPYLP